MKLTVNGEPREVQDGATVRQLIELCGLAGGPVAVERNGEVVIADLLSKVMILDRKNNVVASLGEGQYTSDDWKTVRNQAPGTFAAGRFVCPHGACFDHDGNIFVVEWVEAGRVTNLRHFT